MDKLFISVVYLLLSMVFFSFIASLAYYYLAELFDKLANEKAIELINNEIILESQKTYTVKKEKKYVLFNEAKQKNR